MGVLFFFLSFRGTVVPNMVWTLLGPSSHFAVLCLLISSRLSSALLPVTGELIWAHCLQACLNSWNASGGAERGEGRRGEAAAGAANGEAQMCLVLSSSPHAVWRIKRMTCSSSEQTVERTDLPFCLALYWLVCYCLFCVHVWSWSCAVLWPKWPILYSFILHGDDRASDLVQPWVRTFKLRLHCVNVASGKKCIANNASMICFLVPQIPSWDPE